MWQFVTVMCDIMLNPNLSELQIMDFILFYFLFYLIFNLGLVTITVTAVTWTCDTKKIVEGPETNNTI